MVVIEEKKKCSGCAACFNVCPKRAIAMVPDQEGFLYPAIDKDKCVNCNLCDRVCPYKADWEPKTDLKSCYIGYNVSEEERANSSSGGIFILLAKNILNQGGGVFGAAFDDEFMVHHVAVTEGKNLEKVVGSKYLQSRIEDSFTIIKDYLKEKIMVLFVGTTCQVAGLKQFLKKDYDNLLCVDFVCLGIPSPLVWKDYINTFFDQKKIERVNFKDKSLGWHTFSLSLKAENKEFIKDGKKTLFFTGYFKGLYSRPCCSECQFKNHRNRVSDITLSDSWGCENFAPEMDDNKGLSNIVIHTQHGLNVLNEISTGLKIKKMDFDRVLQYNQNYFVSLPYGQKREAFWNAYHVTPKKALFRRYCTSSYGVKKIIKNLKKTMKMKLRKTWYRL